MADSKKPTTAINANKKDVIINDEQYAKKAPTLPNSLRLKTPNSVSSRQNMSSILQRLPLLRALTENQNSTQSLKPIWLSWCEHQDKANDSLALKLHQHASPTSLRQGSLNIACSSAIVASLIKHQQSSLLMAFHNAGFAHINQLHVQMELTQTSNKQSHASNTDQNSVSPKPETPEFKVSETKYKKQRIKPSSSAIKSIEATESLALNEQLAASLKRLAQTLKSTTD